MLGAMGLVSVQPLALIAACSRVAVEGGDTHDCGQLIKESVGSPPAVGVEGDGAADNPRGLQPAKC